MSGLLSICALVFISRILQPGECSVAEALFRKIDGKYLANYVIEKKHTETELECSMHCVAHGSCVSVNYKTSGIGKGRCELNSKTLKDTSDDDESTRNPDFKHLYIIEKKPITISTQHSSQNVSTVRCTRTKLWNIRMNIQQLLLSHINVTVFEISGNISLSGE
ncbi:uncharacterized protein LOC114525589 [Dendronephthya gigantea]|uniref:uncharacterized protein LOC114525589 n=1 Tax=Dendronephthya gigantea TaxID=151771 RepID=UPI001069F865|nr:uncharacterized protein LOC114525589 [Dendronephthya gigantea]